MTFPDFLIHRDPLSSKNAYGHALLIAGSHGKMGAALLAAKACLRTGAGLITVHVPQCGVNILQTAFPEAMVSIDPNKNIFSAPPHNLDRYSAIAIGPGLGTDELTFCALQQLLTNLPNVPLIMDADALNLVAMHSDALWPLLPHGTILTPHAREFDRLWANSMAPSAQLLPTGESRMEAQCLMAKRHHIVVLHKGHRSIIAGPNGSVCQNSTGNAGMATAGSGDVLTGILLGLAAQNAAYHASVPLAETTENQSIKLSAMQVAHLGAYIHGKSADLAVQNQAQCSLIASDIIENLKHTIV